MFHFTTTNVINSNIDPTTGKPLWSFQEETDTRDASLNIKRINNFKKENVLKVYKTRPVDPAFAKVTIDLSTLRGKKGEFYNISLVLGVSRGGSDVRYNNAIGRARVPFSIDFEFKQDATTTAKAVAKMINSLDSLAYGEKHLKVTADSTFVTFEAKNEYRSLVSVNVQKFDETAYNGMGKYTVVKSLEDLEEKKTPEELTGNVEGYFKGKEGFGTYSYILHNLRIPTPARTTIFGINSDEVPVLGAKYVQYVLHYCVNRGTLGMDAVGDEVHSRTTHVFYVKEDLADAFETELNKVAPDDIEEVPAQ